MNEALVKELFSLNIDSLDREEFFERGFPLIEKMEALFVERRKRHGEVTDVLNGLLGFEAENIPIHRKLYHTAKNMVRERFIKGQRPDYLTIQDVQLAMEQRLLVIEELDHLQDENNLLSARAFENSQKWLLNSGRAISADDIEFDSARVDQLLFDATKNYWRYVSPAFLLLLITYSYDLSLLNRKVTFKKDGGNWVVAVGEAAIIVASELPGAGLAKKGIKEGVERQQHYIQSLANAGNLYARVRHYKHGLGDVAALIPELKQLRVEALRAFDDTLFILDSIEESLRPLEH